MRRLHCTLPLQPIAPRFTWRKGAGRRRTLFDDLELVLCGPRGSDERFQPLEIGLEPGQIPLQLVGCHVDSVPISGNEQPDQREPELAGKRHGAIIDEHFG